MRLRNIPRAESVLEACKEVVKNPESLCGHWNQEFQNERPLHIEIGMGKGQFLLTLAAENPQINYVGIERYSSVLLRAVEKFQELEAEGKAPANIRFICMDANDLPTVFAPAEVPYLPELLRSMAKGPPCKKKTDIQRIFQAL